MALQENYITNYFENTALNLNRLATSKEISQSVLAAVGMIAAAYKKGGGLFLAGNGGSAADAQHISTEMVVKLDRDRTPLKAFALTTDSSMLTAIGNDFSYDKVFYRQIKGLMSPQDIFFGITTSGNSANILKALEACKEIGCKSILLTGKEGGQAKKMNLADHFIVAPGLHTAQIQEAHMAIYHVICFGVEKSLIDDKFIQYY